MPPKEGKRTSRTALEVVSGQIDVVADVHRSEQETVEGEDNDSHQQRNKVPELSADVEQELSEWFADRRHYYDKSEKLFKDKPKKDRMLAEKGKQYNLTGDQLALWFKSQRAMFGRINKGKSGQGAAKLTARQAWVKKNFSFLEDHISVRTKSRQLGKVPCIKTNTDEDEDSEITREEDPTEDIEPGSDTGISHERAPAEIQTRLSCRSTSKNAQRKRLQDYSQVDEAILKLVDQATESSKICQQVEEAIVKTNSPRYAFSQWMGAEINNLPDNLWNSFQREAFDLVMRYKDMSSPQSFSMQIGANPPNTYQIPLQTNQATSTPITNLPAAPSQSTYMFSAEQGLLAPMPGYTLGLTPVINNDMNLSAIYQVASTSQQVNTEEDRDQ